MPDVLPEDLPITGQSLRLVTQQIAQITGFALGGALSGIAPEVALATYAICCVVSAVVVARYVGPRSPPAAARGGYWRSSREVVRVIWKHPGLRVLALLASLLGVTVVPEGLAAAYIAEMGGGAREAGLLMAADPAGMAIGASVLGSRFISAEGPLALMAPLPAVGGLPLLVCLARPGLVLSAVGVHGGRSVRGVSGRRGRDVQPTRPGRSAGAMHGALQCVAGRVDRGRGSRREHFDVIGRTGREHRRIWHAHSDDWCGGDRAVAPSAAVDADSIDLHC